MRIEATDILTTPDKVGYIKEILQPIFSKIIVAVIVLLIGLIIGKILGNIVQKALYEVKLNKLVKNVSGLRLRLEEFVGMLTTYGIFFISFIFAFDILGLTGFIFQMLGFLIMFIIFVSVVLSLKDFFPNLLSGIIIAKKKLLQEGDWIEADTVSGKILQLELLETVVQTKKGDLLYIPNRILTNTRIKKLKKK